MIGCGSIPPCSSSCGEPCELMPAAPDDAFGGGLRSAQSAARYGPPPACSPRSGRRGSTRATRLVTVRGRIIVAGLSVAFLVAIRTVSADPSHGGAPLGKPAESQRGHKMTCSLPADTAFFRVEDLYKLIHHAYLGPGHAIPSREAAASYLDREWGEIGAALPGEPLIEVLAEGAPFVRVNLRPFRDQGGRIDSLLDAFVRSGSEKTDSVSFRLAWHLARLRIATGEIPLSVEAYDSLDAEVRPLGYPAIHHSAAYQERFRPAYRVVAAREAQRLQDGLGAGSDR
jgi:hypothetical protein